MARKFFSTVVPKPICFPGPVRTSAKAPSVTKTIYLTTASTSPYTLPADFNPANFSIEVLGPGGSGGNASSSLGGAGGQGGGYAKIVNAANFAAGASIAFQVGAAGTSNPTWVKDTTTTIAVQGDYGGSATGPAPNNRSQANTGSTTALGGSGGTITSSPAGAGGGGAAGPHGAGSAGTGG